MKINDIGLNNLHSVNDLGRTKSLKQFEDILNNEIKNKDQAKKSTENINDKDSDSDKKAIMKACRQYESYFINEMLKQMRSTMQYSGMNEKSKGEEIFQGMLDQEYADLAAKQNSIGLAQMMYKQLTK